MAFDYTTGNPDNLTGGQPARMGDIQGPFYDIREHLNAGKSGVSLPDSPSVGDTFIWTPSPASIGCSNAPAWWMLWAGANWYFIGGEPARSLAFPAWNLTPAGLNQLSAWQGGPSLTVPRAGDWRVQFGPATSRLVSGHPAGQRSDIETDLIRAVGVGADRLQAAVNSLIGPFSGGEVTIDAALVLAAGDVLRVAQQITAGTLTTIVNNDTGTLMNSRLWLSPSKVS